MKRRVAFGDHVEAQPAKAGDIAAAIPGGAAQRSRAIREMLDSGLLERDERGVRFYRLATLSSSIAPFLIRQLDTLGFLPQMLRDDTE